MTDQHDKNADTHQPLTKRATIFFGLFLCLFQIFLSFPIAVWKRNKFNFEAPLTYSYSVLGLTLAAVVLVSIVAALITPRRIRPFIAPILIVLAAAIFIQQNFLSWNYGILDGQTLDFNQNAGLGFIDLALWIAAIGVLVFAGKMIQRQAANILLGVGLIAVIMTGVNIAGYGEVDPPYSIDESAKFDFSKNENIIVFLLDAFQMDMIHEVADKNPELLKPLDGFTIYEDNVAFFAKTYPTIPLFLTGKGYQKKEPILDFFKTAYDGSLMEILQDEGWDVGLYPNVKAFPSLINAVDISPKIMDNAIGGVPSQAKIKTYLQALDLSLFRAVPHMLKPAIFNKGEFISNRENVRDVYTAVIGETNLQQPVVFKTEQRHKGLEFRELMDTKGSLSGDNPAFRFYHLMFPHAPFTLDADLNVVSHTNGFEIYRDYSIASLKLMGTYLEQLKDIGVYDNSTILIVSDHGMGIGNALQYDPKTKEYITAGQYGYRRASAKSILFVKPKDARGEVSWSQKPTSGLDVAPTIAAAAGVRLKDVDGKQLDEISETDERTRLFNFYSFSTWDSKYLDDFEVFEINGDVRKTSSWYKQGMLTESAQIKNKSTYQKGQLISFGKDVKVDSDFLNPFIDVKKYKMNPNYIEADDGIIDVNIKLKSAPHSNEALLLQFEIYSGDTLDRKIIINGHEKIAHIEPKMRELNRGFFISPDEHQGLKDFNLSFRPADEDVIKPLRLSTVKLTSLSPKNIKAGESFLSSFDEFFPIGFKSQKGSNDVSLHNKGAFIFSADSQMCERGILQIEFKDRPLRLPKLRLNDNVLTPINTAAENQATVSYECSDVEIIRNNVIEMSILNPNSDEAFSTIKKISFVK